MVSELIVFKGKGIRRTLYHDEWWFCVVDVVTILTDSPNPDNYLKNIRRRDKELSNAWKQITHPLSIETDGGKQKLNCANTEGIFRIIQSIPSKKTEPFKKWLAKVGYERIQEIEDPELAQRRMKALYKAKGYPENWIEKRVRGIAVREDLTDQWDK
jgi:prophage antirepressor-like protein